MLMQRGFYEHAVLMDTCEPIFDLAGITIARAQYKPQRRTRGWFEAKTPVAK
jgi:hypothetical protein